MTFLRNTWYVALWSQDLAPEKMVARKFLNEPIVLFRDADGKAAALTDACAHRFAPLSMGTIVKGGGKLNVGTLGIVVPQMHLHVLTRHPGDPAWPGPVWGHSPRIPYDAAARDARMRLVSSH